MVAGISILSQKSKLPICRQAKPVYPLTTFLAVFPGAWAIKEIFVKVALLLIRAYQWILSPVLTPACRFNPTCSEYAYESIRRYGLLKGFFFALKRILRCHPFHPGGIDPVP